MGSPAFASPRVSVRLVHSSWSQSRTVQGIGWRASGLFLSPAVLCQMKETTLCTLTRASKACRARPPDNGDIYPQGISTVPTVPRPRPDSVFGECLHQVKLNLRHYPIPHLTSDSWYKVCASHLPTIASLDHTQARGKRSETLCGTNRNWQYLHYDLHVATTTYLG